MLTPLLEISELYCERDERVLFDNLSFKVQQGEIIHLKGCNGSGKTSLLRIVCGLYQGYEGDVLYKGQPLASVREQFNGSLLYLGHNVSVKQGLTLTENLRWYAKIQPQLDEALIDFAIEQVGLKNYADVYCQNLSAGQKRRVNLARLYMHKNQQYQHSIWILDEPFTAIDVDGVASLESKILEYVKGGGTVILTTHQLLEIKEGVRCINLDD
ncbi:cytochrome c biogenesis heme-transporting ATPase CcmA [Gammaproteobacteria bacterium AS21]